MLGAMGAAAANIDAEDVDEAGRVVAKNDYAGFHGSSTHTTIESGLADDMAAFIVECVPATGTVVGLEALLDLEPKVIVLGNLVAVNGYDHFGQSRAWSKGRDGSVVDRYEENGTKTMP